jgi:hypothetical protein
MRDNLEPRDLQSVSLKPGWREYFIQILEERFHLIVLLIMTTKVTVLEWYTFIG